MINTKIFTNALQNQICFLNYLFSSIKKRIKPNLSFGFYPSPLYLSIFRSLTIILTKDMITAIRTAAPKLEKPKFISPTNEEVIFKIAAFTMKLNKPNVSSVNGSDKIVNTGFTNIFNIDSTNAAMIAIQILLTKIIFGKITESETNVNVLTIKR